MMFRILVLTCFFLSLTAQALDRVTLVGSKIQSSLSSILPKTDYLVVVNRVDALDDGGASQAADGSVRMLPGLQLGVDSKGDLIRQDTTANSYNGPISIHIVIENKVSEATYKTIQKLLPEIVGGLRDEDELKIARGPLRQNNPADSTSPSITINNSSDSKQGQLQDNLKFLALFMLAGGLFFWFLSRMNLGQDNKPKSNPNDWRDEKDESSDAKKSAEVQPSDFAVLDPESVGLFFLKAVKDRKEGIWSKWVKFAPSIHQREVFRHLPSWVLNYLQDVNTKKDFDSQQMERVSLHDLFNEIVLVEQSFKTPIQKQRAFLQWFPPEALRYVPRKQQKEISAATRKTLWHFRPDLGNFVRVENVEIDDLVAEPTDSEIKKCYTELAELTSVSLDSTSTDIRDPVKIWANLINQLSEFGPINAQIKHAQAQLKKEEFEKLTQSVARLESPLEFNESQRKEWLRMIEPEDYLWWSHLLSLSEFGKVQKVDWNLQNDLRPMRFAMFQQAASEKNFEKWSEDDRKQSSRRILSATRKIIDPKWQSHDRDVA